MTTKHAVNSSDYIIATESVLTAGKRLQMTLAAGASPAKLEYAIVGLEQAAEMQDNRGVAYHNFMFSELETATEDEKSMRERMTEDVLASVLTDLQVANVLMAAGQAVGELGEQKEPQKLGEALRRLENTSQIVGQSLASPLKNGVEPGRFGFTEDAGAAEPVKSVDLNSAIKTFKQRSDEVLTSLVNDAKDVVMSAFKALSALNADKMLEAISKLGEAIGDLSKVGRLFSQGLKKLADAVNSLTCLLGEDLLKKVKEQVKKIWEVLKNDKYVTGPLELAFGVKATKEQIDEILKSGSLKLETLDEGSYTLAKLKQSFKENAEILSDLVAAVSVAGTFVALVPAISAQAALVTASIISLILGAVVLIGMDYTDSGIMLNRVRGVRGIAIGLV